jgi:hypothetical protein
MAESRSRLFLSWKKVLWIGIELPKCIKILGTEKCP